jgi:hypothetical protein
MLSRNRRGALLSVALGLVGAVVAAVVFLTSSQAEDVELTTARLVPADAGLYFAVNTDLTSSQWLGAFDFVEKLGQEDPQGELRRSAESENINWENEVAPFLGGDAAVYVGAIPSFDRVEETGFALVVRAKDAERAMRVIEREARARSNGAPTKACRSWPWRRSRRTSSASATTSWSRTPKRAWRRPSTSRAAASPRSRTTRTSAHCATDSPATSSASCTWTRASC